MRSVFIWNNVVGMLAFLPVMFFVRDWPPAAQWWKPAVTGSLLFFGTWTTFAAIRAGDVSLVTPLLGTKVVLTALLVTGLAGTRLPTGLWLASVLTTVGILVLGWKDLRRGQGKGAAIGWVLVSALVFAAADVSLAQWAEGFGKAGCLSVAFAVTGVLSLAALGKDARAVLRPPPAARRYVALGAGLLTVQMAAMGTSIAWFRDPTGINIVYGTRGLWSIALVWYVGKKWFGNEERETAGAVMKLRLAGSLLILGAVLVAVLVRG